MSTLVLNPWADAGLVQGQFIRSREFEVALVGPRGEGKTSAGWRRVMLHAAEQPEETRPIPWAVIRDTWRNLERTTLKSLLQPHPGDFTEKIRPFLKVSKGGEKVVFPGFWECEMFGVDSLGDLSRLQSMQLGGVWVEEPAPAAAEDIGGGLEERVVLVGISSLRHPCNWRTTQVTSNYPDEDHWLWQRYYVKRIGRLFRIPRGENPHLPEDYRGNMEAALSGDEGLLRRLVLGTPGFVVQGEAVTPEYDPLIHRASRDLEPYPNLLGYRFWDGWHSPSCVIAQMTPRGQLQVFECIVGKKVGTKQLIDEFVLPAMDERYRMIPEWEDIGDPSMATADQSDYEQSAASIIEAKLGTVFRGGPKLWGPRKEAVKSALIGKTLDGKFPLLQLSASHLVEPLHQALRGGWHYRKDASGRIVGRVPVKDQSSHPADALSYGIAEVLYLSSAGAIDPFPYSGQQLPQQNYRGDDWLMRKLWERGGLREDGHCQITGY